ncbi:peptidoglycan DD-metalloendopeptidase family protein [Jeongeupia naejangsanensis]|uniref:Peptidoglycan DD-metalloendopeptidase family protein n=1 Tax=Jeongeupia naejangsanensis TaxID=613195 RepID=A0ABS2BNT7_9NEIS|nr:peptidoglycan DD-metalloendopeptidase family protein [Jeongeupia naejangsanensis]MBM3116661.1 peptidoglycan DD-metalloendopeptidase family protein [Jeongeupia naejangsanensis]
MRRVLALTLLLSAGAVAAPAEPVSRKQSVEKQQELKSLRGQIDALKKDLADTESDRKEASDALKDSESAISDANRILGDLNSQRAMSSAELTRLEGDIAAVRSRIEQSQRRLAKLIRTRYKSGELEAWRLLLNQQDPNQVNRTLGYYRYLVAAQQQLASQLENQLATLNQLADEIRAKQDELAAISTEKQRQKSRLQSEQNKRQALVEQLSAEISSQRGQIQKLSADEKRLTGLIDRLNALIKKQEAERARLAAKKRAEAAARAKAVREANARAAAQAKAEGKAAPKPVPEPKAEVNDDLPDASLSGKAFASLKGKLKLPAKGEIVGRYGAQRAEGTTWKGMMIKAAPGQPVHAVASGRVVFADWLRGFGNLVIVEHGGGYMTLYAGNEAVLKHVGDSVNAGDTIATSGNTGGMADSGVYFELRQNGRPLDPQGWIG